jgi:60S ribosome subunit biogenesis protein NIP7
VVGKTHENVCYALRENRERIMRRATNIQRKKLVSIGVCFGKFTKTQKFKLHVTALDFLAQYARVRAAPLVIPRTCVYPGGPHSENVVVSP